MEYFGCEDFVNPDKWTLYQYERNCRDSKIQRLEQELQNEKERKRKVTPGWTIVRTITTLVALVLMSRTDATPSAYLAVFAMAYTFGFAEAFAK